MKSLKTMTGDALEQLIDYKVIDQDGEHIGSLHSLWSDPATGAVEFLGVKTGWLFGHNHVVPADKAELDEANGAVRLPYTEAFIKEAPSMSADSEISEEEEANIYRYYKTTVQTAPVKADELPDYSSTGFETIAMPVTSSKPPIPKADPADYAPIEGAASVVGGGSIGGMGVNPGSRLRKISRPAEVADAPVGQDPAASVGLEAGERTIEFRSEGEAVGAAAGGGSNPDPITGEPGAHPVGVGAGAASAGAAGAALGGAVGGPLGAAVGGIAGAVGGGLAGKGVAESINPTAEGAYWQENFRHAPYYESGREYTDYEPAYRAGYEGYTRYGASGRDYADVEPELERDYRDLRGASNLSWEEAKKAARDAWERLKADDARTQT